MANQLSRTVYQIMHRYVIRSPRSSTWAPVISRRILGHLLSGSDRAAPSHQRIQMVREDGQVMVWVQLPRRLIDLAESLSLNQAQIHKTEVSWMKELIRNPLYFTKHPVRSGLDQSQLLGLLTRGLQTERFVLDSTLLHVPRKSQSPHLVLLHQACSDASSQITRHPSTGVGWPVSSQILVTTCYSLRISAACHKLVNSCCHAVGLCDFVSPAAWRYPAALACCPANNEAIELQIGGGSTDRAIFQGLAEKAPLG